MPLESETKLTNDLVEACVASGRLYLQAAQGATAPLAVGVSRCEKPQGRYLMGNMKVFWIETIV